MDVQAGYVTIDGNQKAATLSESNDRLNLEVTDSGPFAGFTLPEQIEILTFSGSRNAYTLLSLQKISSQTRLGVGSTINYRVQLVIEDVMYSNRDEIRSSTWLLYLEEFSKIIHVTGLAQSYTFDDDGTYASQWVYRPIASVILSCPRSCFDLHVGQGMTTGGDPFVGPTMSFRYPIRLVSVSELHIDTALILLSRIRLFFSLIMGRVLAIDEISLRLRDNDHRHDAKVHGLIRTDKSVVPASPIVDVPEPERLSQMLDEFIQNFDMLSEALYLHMDGLEQQRLSLQLRFQLFVQALEALHRRTSIVTDAAIDVSAVATALQQLGIPNNVIDRVGGVLAHAHEPGLRQRLKGYWDQFSDEIATLRPLATKNEFVGRVVATRNHFAHRTDRDSQVLQGGDLYDYTETVKAISQMSLLSQIGCNTNGIGRSMRDKRFVDYIERAGTGISFVAPTAS